MNTTLEMGAVAQGMLKKLLWVEYMFHSDHVEASPSDRSAQITLLGNDAEEGVRGIMLTLGGFNTLLEAMRELMLATPIHLFKPQVERFTRWWVQTVDGSGLQMSEDFQTGEVVRGKKGPDEDEDGIPFVRYSHGRYGVAPVPAGKVAVNLGGPKNVAFQQVKGDRYISAGKVKYAYVFKPPEEPLAILLPEEKRQTPGTPPSVQRVAAAIPEAAGDGAFMKRELLERFDGTLVPLPPSQPITRGSDLAGAEIYRLNCAACHGEHGEGIPGRPLQTIATTQREEIKKVPLFGRFEKGMPPWGKGGVSWRSSTAGDATPSRTCPSPERSPRCSAMPGASSVGIGWWTS